MDTAPAPRAQADVAQKRESVLLQSVKTEQCTPTFALLQGTCDHFAGLQLGGSMRGGTTPQSDRRGTGRCSRQRVTAGGGCGRAPATARAGRACGNSGGGAVLDPEMAWAYRPPSSNEKCPGADMIPLGLIDNL